MRGSTNARRSAPQTSDGPTSDGPTGDRSGDSPEIHVADLADLDARLTRAVEHRNTRAVVRILRDLRAARPAAWIDQARRVQASVDERAGSFLMSHVAACIFFEEADDDLAIEAIQEGERRAREIDDEPS